MLTTASFFNSMPVAQIAKLFGAASPPGDKLHAAQQPKAQQQGAIAGGQTLDMQLPNIVSEALQTIQALAWERGGRPRRPASPSPRCL
jgi:hypothetical protein